MAPSHARPRAGRRGRTAPGSPRSPRAVGEQVQVDVEKGHRRRRGARGAARPRCPPGQGSPAAASRHRPHGGRPPPPPRPPAAPPAPRGRRLTPARSIFIRSRPQAARDHRAGLTTARAREHLLATRLRRSCAAARATGQFPTVTARQQAGAAGRHDEEWWCYLYGSMRCMPRAGWKWRSTVSSQCSRGPPWFNPSILPRSCAWCCGGPEVLQPSLRQRRRRCRRLAGHSLISRSPPCLPISATPGATGLPRWIRRQSARRVVRWSSVPTDYNPGLTSSLRSEGTDARGAMREIPWAFARELLQCQHGIDRIFSRTCDVKQQKASRNAEVFVKTFHAVDFIHTCHCPVVMRNERGSQRVYKQEQS